MNMPKQETLFEKSLNAGKQTDLFMFNDIHSLYVRNVSSEQIRLLTTGKNKTMKLLTQGAKKDDKFHMDFFSNMQYPRESYYNLQYSNEKSE